MHHQYMLSSKGEHLLTRPIEVMSPNSKAVLKILASSHDITLDTENSQARGMQVKPTLVKSLETQMWQQGDGFDETSPCREIC